MQRLSGVLVAVMLLMLVTMPAIHASEETARVRINYLAYPVDWDGKSIMIGARLQVPLNMTSKIPAVVIFAWHGRRPK